MEKAAKRTPHKRPKGLDPIPSPQALPSLPNWQKSTYKQTNKIDNPFVEVPDEVRRVQLTKLQKQQKRASMHQPLVNPTDQKSSNLRFDLRQAVIQSAILDRPYK